MMSCATLATLKEWQDGLNECGRDMEQMQQSRLGRALCQRYCDDSNQSPASASDNDRHILLDRLNAYRSLVAALPSVGFDPSLPIAVVASPGRARLMMGHTDLAGLGGFTIDCATKEELLCAAQARVRRESASDESIGGFVYLHNSDSSSFPSARFSFDSLRQVADRCHELYGSKCFDASTWDGYARAALTYMICEKFAAYKEMRKELNLPMPQTQTEDGENGRDMGRSMAATDGLNSTERESHEVADIHFYVTSPGLLHLSHSGGLSSSAALTGALSLALVSLFPSTSYLGLRSHRHVLATVDFGEYFLSKFAGAADKMAQLFAVKTHLTVIQSFPESFRRTLPFPNDRIKLLMAHAPIPRLTLRAHSESFLADTRGYSPIHCQRILTWAGEVMESFGSVAYVTAAEVMRRKLKDATLCQMAGIEAWEAELVEKALCTHLSTDANHDQNPTNSHADAGTLSTAAATIRAASQSTSSSALSHPSSLPSSSIATPPSAGTSNNNNNNNSGSSSRVGLLRELCHGGSLEHLCPSLRGWDQRWRRYHLIYRLLRLLPERYIHLIPQATKHCDPSPCNNERRAILLHLRKAALYGLSEVERGEEYLRCIDAIQTCKEKMARLSQRQQQQQQQPITQPSEIASLKSEIDCHVQRILHLVSVCHDGDRAVVDYRRLRAKDEIPTVEDIIADAELCPSAAVLRHDPPIPLPSLPACTERFFEPTPWASDARNDVSDTAITRWIDSLMPMIHATNRKADIDVTHSTCKVTPQELSDLPGGFERGLIDVDEMADEIRQHFAAGLSSPCSSSISTSSSSSLPRHLSVRISAAGLGGRVCIHADSSCADDAIRYLTQRGWTVHIPTPAAPTQLMTLNQQDVDMSNAQPAT